MRRIDRSLNVFSVSAIDVFASALGAFMLIAFVMLPYFPNISKEPPRPLLKSPPFLAFLVYWDAAGADVDLYVTEILQSGERREFSYNRHNRDGQHYANSQAQLSVDVQAGPGVEIWETPQVLEGARYQFTLVLHGGRQYQGGDVRVSGRVYHGNGYWTLTPRLLKSTDRTKKLLVVEGRVNDNRLTFETVNRWLSR